MPSPRKPRRRRIAAPRAAAEQGTGSAIPGRMLRLDGRRPIQELVAASRGLPAVEAVEGERMDPAAKQAFIDYLERHLCVAPRPGFVKVGPRSFLFQDERDTVFVKVGNENLIIVTDGTYVIDHIQMHFLALREVDEDVFNEYMQEILAVF